MSSCRPLPSVALSFMLAAGCASRSAPEGAAAAGSPEPLPPRAQLSQSQELVVDVRALDDEKKEDSIRGGVELSDDAPPPVQASSSGKGQKLKASKHEEGKAQNTAAERVPGQVQGATSEKVAASVDPSLIQRAVATHPELFDRCLQGSDVSIEIDATIAPSGKVIDAKCTRSVPDDPKLRDCVVEGFRRLSVGALTNDVPARVKFALALKRPGH